MLGGLYQLLCFSMIVQIRCEVLPSSGLESDSSKLKA